MLNSSLREKYFKPQQEGLSSSRDTMMTSEDDEEIEDYEAIPFHPLYKAMSFYDTTNITIEEEEVDAIDHTQMIQLQMKEIWDTVQLKAVWKPMVLYILNQYIDFLK